MSRVTSQSPDAWIGEEWRLARAARGAFARARRRPLRLALAASLVTGALVTARALKPPSYEATLYFRLSEGDFSQPGVTPRPPRDIRQHIANVALSRHQIEQLMRKYRMSTAWLARDPAAAVEDFRDDLAIEVSRNYFLFDRGRNEAPRTAQVTVSLTGSDPEDTQAMLREIGAAVLRGQADQRGARMAQIRALLELELSQLRARTLSLQGQIEQLSLQALKAVPQSAVPIRARIAGLELEARSAIEQALALERRLGDLSFSGAAEEEQLGFHFQLFDERLVTYAPRLGSGELALRAAITFLVALLLLAPLLGAFDDRIYAPSDLADVGPGLVGAFPRFPGDQAGSFQARHSQGRIAWTPSTDRR